VGREDNLIAAATDGAGLCCPASQPLPRCAGRVRFRSASVLAWLLFAMVTRCFSQQPGTKIWEFNAGERVNSSPALGADGTIYFGAGATLYALNPDGTPKWRFPARGQIFSSPALASDGTVYFGCFDNKLYAVSQTGTLKWTFRTGGWIYSSPAVDMNGTIYVGSDDNSLYAVKPDGTRKWSFATGGYVRGSPAIGADGTIYVGSWDNQLYALSADGIQQWAFETGHYLYSSPAVGSDGTIYVGSVDKKLYAVNHDGTKKWEFATDSHIYSSPAIGPDGTIYVGSWDNRLYAVSLSGTQKWSFATANLVQSSPAVAIEGTNVSIFVGSDENKLYALGGDGTKKWAFATGSLVRSSPVVSPEGTIYFGSEDGRFYAVRSPSGLAGSPWPMFRSGARHRGKVLLVIGQQPQSQMVVVNQPANFIVLASGAGPLSYQWRLNGTNLPNAITSELSITNTLPINAGDYTVIVHNPAETVTSSPASLTVVVPPTITLQPLSQTNTAGSDTIFKVGASSVGPLSYLWLFNGKNLAASNSPSLLLPAVMPSQAGAYSVVVTNAAGAITSAVATLTVLTAPEITTPPRDQIGAVGTNITFTVAAQSPAPLAYQWRFNGTNIAGGTSTNLVLRNVQPPNAGNYSVVVTNIAGSTTSPTALLTVTLPPIITAQPMDQTGVAGGAASFRVTATSAGPLTYQWKFNDTDLTNATANTLTLAKLDQAQAGTYTVVVANVAGSVSSAPAVLTVLVPPTITAQPQSQTSSLGADAVFNVVASGSPPLEFFWQFKGTSLTGATNNSLRLTRLTPMQAGAYSVIITNAAGSVTSQPAELTIPARRSWWERVKSWF
jgi:outer membrane protein assembly factor BamB